MFSLFSIAGATNSHPSGYYQNDSSVTCRYFIFDKMSANIKNSSPQVVVSGRSAVFKIGDLPAQISVNLTASNNLYENTKSFFPPFEEVDPNNIRPLMLAEKQQNGTITFFNQGRFEIGFEIVGIQK